jgi:DNA-binding response OmpR family regulator
MAPVSYLRRLLARDLYLDDRMIFEPAALRQPSVSLRHGTALIVEDDPRLQGAMSKEFARMHFGVLSARHHADAVHHLKGLPVDIVCIDIGLPNESGYEVCEYIRGALGLTRVPIIATSEHGTCHDMAQAEEAGANAFLLKPFSMRQLAACVRSMLDWTPGRALPRHELALRYHSPADRAAHIAQAPFAASAG